MQLLGSYFACAVICFLYRLCSTWQWQRGIQSGAECVRSVVGGGMSLPSGFLWICLNMLLYQSLGLFTLWYKKRGEVHKANNPGEWGFEKCNTSIQNNVQVYFITKQCFNLSYWSGGDGHPSFIHWADSWELDKSLLSSGAPAAWYRGRSLDTIGQSTCVTVRALWFYQLFFRNERFQVSVKSTLIKI